MTTESLEFKITLSGTYWDNLPEYAILLDGVEKSRAVVSTDSGQVFDVLFTADIEEDAEHTLSITLINKLDSDTVENADKTGIERDMLLNIVEVEIDGISLESLKWSHSEYNVTMLPEPVYNCVNLGWNGSWDIKFSSPFYIWLLENM
jgi:hypothetical protein